VPGAVRPERGLAPSGHCVLQLQEQRLRGRYGSRPSRLILLGIFLPAQLKDDVPLVRLEDDLALATFAHGPPEGATVMPQSFSVPAWAKRFGHMAVIVGWKEMATVYLIESAYSASCPWWA
jgi:hypothetical protein